MVSSRAWELHLRFPDVFKTPEEAEAWLKWALDDSEEAILVHVEAVRRARLQPKMKPEDDPEVVVED